MLELQTAIEKELAERRAKMKGPYSRMARETTPSPSPEKEKDKTGDDVGGNKLREAIVRLSGDSEDG